MQASILIEQIDIVVTGKMAQKGGSKNEFEGRSRGEIDIPGRV